MVYTFNRERSLLLLAASQSVREWTARNEVDKARRSKSLLSLSVAAVSPVLTERRHEAVTVTSRLSRTVTLEQSRDARGYKVWGILELEQGRDSAA